MGSDKGSLIGQKRCVCGEYKKKNKKNTWNEWCSPPADQCPASSGVAAVPQANSPQFIFQHDTTGYWISIRSVWVSSWRCSLPAACAPPGTSQAAWEAEKSLSLCKHYDPMILWWFCDSRILWFSLTWMPMLVSVMEQSGTDPIIYLTIALWVLTFAE